VHILYFMYIVAFRGTLVSGTFETGTVASRVVLGVDFYPLFRCNLDNTGFTPCLLCSFTLSVFTGQYSIKVDGFKLFKLLFVRTYTKSELKGHLQMFIDV